MDDRTALAILVRAPAKPALSRAKNLLHSPAHTHPALFSFCVSFNAGGPTTKGAEGLVITYFQSRRRPPPPRLPGRPPARERHATRRPPLFSASVLAGRLLAFFIGVRAPVWCRPAERQSFHTLPASFSRRFDPLARRPPGRTSNRRFSSSVASLSLVSVDGVAAAVFLS